MVYKTCAYEMGYLVSMILSDWWPEPINRMRRLKLVLGKFYRLTRRQGTALESSPTMTQPFQQSSYQSNTDEYVFRNGLRVLKTKDIPEIRYYGLNRNTSHQTLAPPSNTDNVDKDQKEETTDLHDNQLVIPTPSPEHEPEFDAPEDEVEQESESESLPPPLHRAPSEKLSSAAETMSGMDSHINSRLMNNPPPEWGGGRKGAATATAGVEVPPPLTREQSAGALNADASQPWCDQVVEDDSGDSESSLLGNETLIVPSSIPRDNHTPGGDLTVASNVGSSHPSSYPANDNSGALEGRDTLELAEVEIEEAEILAAAAAGAVAPPHRNGSNHQYHNQIHNTPLPPPYPNNTAASSNPPPPAPPPPPPPTGGGLPILRNLICPPVTWGPPHPDPHLGPPPGRPAPPWWIRSVPPP